MVIERDGRREEGRKGIARKGSKSNIENIHIKTSSFVTIILQGNMTEYPYKSYAVTPSLHVTVDEETHCLT